MRGLERLGYSYPGDGERKGDVSTYPQAVFKRGLRPDATARSRSDMWAADAQVAYVKTSDFEERICINKPFGGQLKSSPRWRSQREGSKSTRSDWVT